MQVAEEQAALRRVATLVARGATPTETFDSVAAQTGRLLKADVAAVIRYEADRTGTIVGLWRVPGVEFPDRRRLRIRGDGPAARVLETGRAVHLEAFAGPDESDAHSFAQLGARTGVGAPITIDGRLWGAVVAGTTRSPGLPAGSEGRLAGFAELTATALAGAEERAELRRIADEQAALRNVATLIAAAAQPEEVFAAVATEIGRLLHPDLTAVLRYDDDDVVTVLGTWSRGGTPVPFSLGTRMPLGGKNIATLVREQRRPVRLDEYREATGAPAEVGHSSGFRAAVGAPIAVEGRLWGLMTAVSRRDEPLPAGTETRLANFAELVATAIANAEAGTKLRGFAEEQAALRKVATLVARGASPEQVFAAVTTEVGNVLRCDYTLMSRYDPDDAAVVVGAWATAGFAVPLAVSRRIPLGDRNVHTLVARSRRPARLDSYGPDAGAAPAAALAAGMHSAVGAPIEVDGRLWGVMIAASRGEPLPADTEGRLAGFIELVATAVANAETQAQLTASRARTVAAADATRRRIERDLHDSVQQRVVSLALEVRVARHSLPPDAGAAAARLDRVAEGVTGVLDELREVTRGINPAALTQGGLRSALRALARRSPIPLRLEFAAPERLPGPIELAAYYTIAEALTNTVNHASATAVDVGVAAADGKLRLEVRDDGCGGATVGRGSGLIGLTDRVEALGGKLTLHSPPGAGTTLRVVLPLSVPTPPEPGRTLG